MGGPSLNLRGSFCGYVVECDGEVIAGAPTFEQAAALYREFRAARVFAAEELRHVLSKQSERRA